VEHILEQSYGAGDRQLVCVLQLSAVSAQPWPTAHRALHISREHAGGGRVTQAPFLNPPMLHRFHLDRRQIDDMVHRSNRPGNQI